MMRSESKADPRVWLSASLLLLAFVLAYFGTIRGLFDVWYNEEDYSYGYLIPLITVYLLWERKKEIISVPLGRSWVGGGALLVFLLVSLYGILGSSPSAVRPLVPFVLLAIVLFCFGTRLLKITFFPLFFLIFMIPLPTAYQTNIGVPLKLVSTKLGAGILQVFGISVFTHGNVIDLGVTQLQVVDACSGLRYILPLLAIGVLVAYFFERSRWKQVVLVVLTIPIAVITNGIRIAATGVLAQKYGPEMAEGFFHAFSGWLVFMFAFVILFLAYFVLRKIGKSSRGGRTGPADGAGRVANGGSADGGSRLRLLPVVITICALLLMAGIAYSTGALPNLAMRNGFSGFPLTVGPWSGQVQQVTSDVVSASGAEEAFSAEYKEKTDNPVFLYVGYRGSPFIENANFFHSPNVCLPSSGWTTLEQRRHKIEQVPRFGSIVVTEMLIQQEDARQLVYYWFQTKNRSSYDINVNRFHLTLHALRRDNTYDLFVRPITPLSRNERVEEAEKRMDRFVRAMMGSLLGYVDGSVAMNR